MTEVTASSSWSGRVSLAAGVLALTLGCTEGMSPGGPAPTGMAATLDSPELAPPGAMRRLSKREFDATVFDLLGDTSRPGSINLGDYDSKNPFDNDYASLSIDYENVAGIERAAGDIVQRVLASADKRRAVFGCDPSGPTDMTCFRTFIGKFAQRAFRRAVDADELAKYETLFTANVKLDNDFNLAAGVVLQSVLQDPEFIYRVERGTPVAGGVTKLDGWSMASRLSYTLWGTMPDDALFADAASGALLTTPGVAAAAKRMIAAPRAMEVITSFHTLLLEIDPRPNVKAADLKVAESKALVARIFKEARPWQDFLRLGETFVNAELAALYKLPAPAVPAGQSGWVVYPAASGRKGYLGHGSFLSNGVLGVETSPTLRGKVVRERFLCTPMPQPPPEIAAVAAAPPVGTGCKVVRYSAHSADAKCAGCHQPMDPIGFGLENFDPEGTYRAGEAGRTDCPISGDGEVKGLAADGKFKGLTQLADLLARSPEVGDCMVQQFYKFAIGSSQLDARGMQFAKLLAAKVKAGNGDFTMQDLVQTMVTAEAFRFSN